MLNFVKKKIFLNLIFLTVIFIIDRLSKILIINLSNNYEQLEYPVTSFLNLNLVWNDGIAFGLLSFEENFIYNLISIIIFIIIVILSVMLINSQDLKRLALLLVLGGALGNFFDRLYYSAVPDFIDFHFRGFHWFIFNVADIFITIGVFCLIYVELFNNKDELNDKNF